ncbi:hypothetical protein [Caballeronia sp. LZ001]|uniref:hypothetical protein n=1 Tax=Caballeronia sp. LZ001 TaxID=3038553 RepID=UPI00285D526E|nr:hypothetical protein [Caballeronia sp. LZ001]MDR5802129.1 hypothetical protein [Caballeronia sp. LZ001]
MAANGAVFGRGVVPLRLAKLRRLQLLVEVLVGLFELILVRQCLRKMLIDDIRVVLRWQIGDRIRAKRVGRRTQRCLVRRLIFHAAKNLTDGIDVL